MKAPKSSSNVTPITQGESFRETAAGGPNRRRDAGIIVDQSLAVLEFLGRTGSYLELPSGKPTFNLVTMVKPGLRRRIFRAIQEVKRLRKAVRLCDLEFEAEGQTRKTDIEVSELEGRRSGERAFQVLFKDRGGRSPRPKQKKQEKRHRPQTQHRYLEQCRRHFETTKRYLETIVEENERAIGELQAACRDRDATVARLEATQEEVETINAELEAANRELERVNQSLRLANHRLQDAIRQRERAEKERRRLEEKLLQTQKLESLGVLAGGIAHDFNNLLVGVLGNASLLLDDLHPGSPLRPVAEEIEKAGQRAADLVNQLLAYSGKGKFVVERCSLSGLAGEMTVLLKSVVSKKAIIECRFADDLPEIEADAIQIRQLVMNLITNASEAIGEGPGVVRIATGVMDADRECLAEAYLGDGLPEGRYVFLEVADNGCGMDPKTREKIFDPFFTTKLTGRGLGLAAVLGIVRAHRGAIKLESQPQLGTRFCLLFPACEKRSLERRGPAEADRPGPCPPARILVVDDEEHVRRLAATILERAGLSVLAAGSGEEALDLFRNRSLIVDAVLLDLTMPGIDGVETFRELRKTRPDIRVILSSGYTENETHTRFPIEDAHAFIQKPYRPKQLVEAIRSVMKVSA